MATLPRTYNTKFKANVSTPFSTSSRNLQEVSLPASEGHDVTGESGVSLKQYEEQLNTLRKENFHLKLRVYFLEEKLGNGSPPAVQGLLEVNVRLQVEIEELRRQLKDTQELLAAAAEAIHVVEQKGSLSTDSVESSIDISTTFRGKTDITHHDEIDLEKFEHTENETTEINGDTLGISINSESSELSRLRLEYGKALQMIKSCFKKILQQEKEIKKLTLQNDAMTAQMSDETQVKNVETLKCKDQHIKELEHKIKDLQTKNGMDNDINANGNLHELLTRRMQGLAYFLDKLLAHKCVIGEDKRKLAESILEQSLALPVGLKLDDSMTLEDFSIDESNLDISQSLRLEDLTMVLGHHNLGCDDSSRRISRRFSKPSRVPREDALSESESWSEPDREVSRARIGLRDFVIGERESVTDYNKQNRRRRSKISYGRSNDARNDSMLQDEINRLSRRVAEFEVVEKSSVERAATAKERIDALEAERDALTAATKTHADRVTVLELKLRETAEAVEKLRNEKSELESTLCETEVTLRRAADEAALQASRAALERAQAQRERLHAERELQEARDELAAARDECAELRARAAHKTPSPPRAPRPPPRAASPDLGIDSDRLSSLENNDEGPASPRSLYEENLSLKDKVSRLKTTLADTLTKLHKDNKRKVSVQRAICRQIHKTNDVLRIARHQLENKNEDELVKEEPVKIPADNY